MQSFGASARLPLLYARSQVVVAKSAPEDSHSFRQRPSFLDEYIAIKRSIFFLNQSNPRRLLQRDEHRGGGGRSAGGI